MTDHEHRHAEPTQPDPDRTDGADVSTGTTNETGDAVPTAIPELVIISGMSGAGRSTAAKCLEDLGWFVVDNLPPALIPTMVELGARSQGNVARIAVVVDVRGRRFFDNLRESLADLDTKHVTRRIVFLESSDDALVRRFESVRRPHPSRATAGSSTASRPSATCCANCAATPTSSSTPPASTSTSCAPRWTPSSPATRSRSSAPR